MREVTTADVLDWLGNENSFTTVVEILTSLLNGTDTLENIRNEIQEEPGVIVADDLRATAKLITEQALKVYEDTQPDAMNKIQGDA
jgi:hypothetical protein